MVTNQSTKLANKGIHVENTKANNSHFKSDLGPFYVT